MRLSAEDYDVALPILHNELRKQRGICTMPILRLRLYYYYRSYLPIWEFPWTEIWWLMLDAIDFGDVVRFVDNDKWIHSASADIRRLRSDYARKQPTEHRWRDKDMQAIGNCGEDVVRAAMTRTGFKSVRQAFLIHPGDGRKVDIDAQGFLPNGPGRPLAVAGEVKNRTSEILQAPTAVMDRQKLFESLKRSFEAAAGSGHIPIVFIPQVHRSAYGWLNQYDALACRMLFQWIPDEQLAKDIKKHFRFGHAISVSDPDKPPKQVIQTLDAWLKRLPSLLQSREEPPF